MKFKAVLFDLGSTLINYENHNWDELGYMGCKSAAELLVNEIGLHVPADKLWDNFHNTIDQMFLNHTEDLAEIDLYQVTADILKGQGITTLDGLPKRFLDAYYLPITNQISLLPGANEILSQIKNSGMKIGLISNTIFPAAFHRAEMTRFDILRYFDFTIFSSEFKFRKPKKEIYLNALSLAGAKADDTVFIGDRLVEDVGGPQSVGIKGILKFTDDRDYSAKIVPFKTIRELDELEKIILE